MSYNGSGTFIINSTGQPVVAGTVISSSAFNSLTNDLATGLTTAITKDGQTTTTARITFAQGVTSSLVTDSSSVSTGSIITAGGVGVAKNIYVGGSISSAAATALTLQSAGTTAITVDTSQNVGIGTASPSTKLHVKSTANDVLTVESTNTYAFLDFTNPTGTAGIGNSGNFMRFDTGGTERMRIDSSGNLLVGATSLYGGEKLAVLQSTNNRGVVLQQTNASNTSIPFNIDCSRNTTNSTYSVIQYFNSGAGLVRFVVQDSGNVQNTNNSYGAVSDIKLKENIVDASPKLEDLCKVKIRQYNLKSDPTHKQIGVVAQELEEVFAGMVEESPDRDADGNDLGTTTKAVKYSVFVPMLIKAIQELKAINDTQAETINALTARITALENA